MEKVRLKRAGWVLVADGEKALFLRNEGDVVHPNLRVLRNVERTNPPTREQGSDRPGRFADAGGPNAETGNHRSGVADTDWHRLSKSRFASELAEMLLRHAHKGEYAQLVIVAPPQVLGELRKALHSEVSDRLVAEIDKDLTGHTVDHIERLILEAG